MMVGLTSCFSPLSVEGIFLSHLLLATMTPPLFWGLEKKITAAWRDFTQISYESQQTSSPDEFFYSILKRKSGTMTVLRLSDLVSLIGFFWLLFFFFFFFFFGHQFSLMRIENIFLTYKKQSFDSSIFINEKEILFFLADQFYYTTLTWFSRHPFFSWCPRTSRT